MYVAARGVLVCLPQIRQSGRYALRIDLPRRAFATLARHKLKQGADVIGSGGKLVSRRSTHGKGEAKEDVTFALFRWCKVVWGKMFGKYLLITNVLGSGLLMVVGDVIAQEYEYRRGLKQQDRFDGARMYRMFVAGALQGPLHHYVYNWMDRIMPQRTFRNILNKILIDQLFMSPACILIFFYSVCYLERQTLQATNNEIVNKFPYIYLLDWMTWPAAQYINFRYLDTKYRVAFVNVCTAVYNVLISYVKHDFGLHLPLEPVVESFVENEAKSRAASRTG
ncbi:CG32263 [Drosophila busckii]|uniref:CG32263 n=1 Tax=Drosophila busckii TaxID=30019 RepID=A0A0M4EZ42_DROBS|nr:mpv17-like protein 2 [Drosophila busckii]ALC43900.1 CG32263 [Drosophila busckii]